MHDTSAPPSRRRHRARADGTVAGPMVRAVARTMVRVMVCTVVCTVTLGIVPTTVARADGDTGQGGSDRDEIIAEAIAAQQASSDGTDSGATRPSCRWRARTAMNALSGRREPVTRVRRGQTWVLGVRECAGPPVTRTRLWVRQKPPGSGSSSARTARRRLPAPRLATAPTTDAVVVKVPMWFWVPRHLWRPVSVSVTVPTLTGPLTVTTTATPQRLEFDAGDGSPVRQCRGPGSQWTALHGDRARSSCMHTYARASHTTPTGAYRARLTTVWKVTWRTNRGVSGRAPDARTHTGADIVVREIQAVGRR